MVTKSNIRGIRNAQQTHNLDRTVRVGKYENRQHNSYIRHEIDAFSIYFKLWPCNVKDDGYMKLLIIFYLKFSLSILRQEE